jgi:hypothetical protein
VPSEKPANVLKTRKTPPSPTSSIAKGATPTDPHAAARAASAARIEPAVAVVRKLSISSSPRESIPITGISLADLAATPHANTISLKLNKHRSLADRHRAAPLAAPISASERKFPALLRFKTGANSLNKFTFLTESGSQVEIGLTPSKQTAKIFLTEARTHISESRKHISNREPTMRRASEPRASSVKRGVCSPVSNREPLGLESPQLSDNKGPRPILIANFEPNDLSAIRTPHRTYENYLQITRPLRGSLRRLTPCRYSGLQLSPVARVQLNDLPATLARRSREGFPGVAPGPELIRGSIAAAAFHTQPGFASERTRVSQHNFSTARSEDYCCCVSR